MQILNLPQSIEDVYFDPNFIVLLESHITYLRTTNISTVVVSSHQGYKYEGDFYGLLGDLNILKKFHYIVMRVNGYESSADFDGNITHIVTPDFNEIDLLKNVYQTKNNF